MAKAQIKQWRKMFREQVFARDDHKCRMCGRPAADPHHIVHRSELPNGGYVKENGISLCADCHLKAEEFHQNGVPHPGYSPEELYAKIGSSHEKAKRASERLGTDH